MPASADGMHWSYSGNWVGASAPAAAMGAMHFPVLTSPACTAQPPTATCYWSTNDISGMSASGLTIDDGAQYYISGNQIALGAGGISAAPSINDTSAGSPYVAVPLQLTAPQTWSVAGGNANQQLALAGAVTGGSNALTIALSNQTTLGLYADDEVGAVKVTGTGGPSYLHIGFPDNPGALNATTGNPVTVSDGVKLVADPAATGPLTMTGSALQVGDAYSGGTMTVNGGVTLDSTSSVSMYIHRPGTRAGTDFSQLSATGDINLGGASLDLGGQTILGEVASCPALTPGDVDTLVKTTGSITGTFAGVPDGATIPLDCPQSVLPAPTVTIHYTANAVTATVVTSGGTPTTTSVSADPTGALTTNQSVTLSATVSAGETPAGTVEFDSNGTPIAGCLDRPLARDGSGTATCQTSFGATSLGDAVTAVFRPMDDTDLQGSADGSDLVVGKSSTTTAVSVSNPAPTVGATITYAAIVASDQIGPLEPSGTVQFLDGGVPIDACSNQPLTAGASSSAATCTLSYSGVGSHNITASYLGDRNFTGSTSSPAQVVTVHAAAASGSPSSRPPANSPPPIAPNSPPTQSSPGAAPVPEASAPHCTLRANRLVSIGGKNRPMLMLSATCDQDTTVIVRGTLTRRRVPGAQRGGRVVRLAATHVSLKAGQATRFAIRLPAPAFLALRRGSTDSAAFTLTATNASGTTRVQLRVPSLKL